MNQRFIIIYFKLRIVADNYSELSRTIIVILTHKFTPYPYKDVNWNLMCIGQSSYSHEIVSPQTRNFLLIYKHWPRRIKMISYCIVCYKFTMYFWYTGNKWLLFWMHICHLLSIILTFTWAALWYLFSYGLLWNQSSMFMGDKCWWIS